MHLGITGTRNGLSEPQFDVIKELISEDDTITHLHEGDCIGVDAQITHMFQVLHPKVIIVRHPALKRTTQYGGFYHETRKRKGYLERDQDNVNESDCLWAAPKGTEIIRSGTWATVRMARKKGIPITIIMPDGKAIYE